MGSARGNWDPRKSQQPFRPNPNGAGDRTTTLRRLLIGAVAFTSRLWLLTVFTNTPCMTQSPEQAGSSVTIKQGEEGSVIESGICHANNYEIK